MPNPFYWELEGKRKSLCPIKFLKITKFKYSSLGVGLYNKIDCLIEFNHLIVLINVA
jgi:hypothetical protein